MGGQALGRQEGDCCINRVGILRAIDRTVVMAERMKPLLHQGDFLAVQRTLLNDSCGSTETRIIL